MFDDPLGSSKGCPTGLIIGEAFLESKGGGIKCFSSRHGTRFL